MANLILNGFVQDEGELSEFEVYLVEGSMETFTIVDLKKAKHGWVTLNASGGLNGFKEKYGVYYQTISDFTNKHSVELPNDSYFIKDK